MIESIVAAVADVASSTGRGRNYGLYTIAYFFGAVLVGAVLRETRARMLIEGGANHAR